MSLIETVRDPSPRDRKALSLALVALGVVIAFMVWFKPASFLVISCVSGVAWCASMLLNKDEPPGRQWKGAIVPLSAGLLYAAVGDVASASTIAAIAAVAFVALGVVVWLHDGFGSRFYKTWLQLFLPLAWSVSTLLLVLVYYAVLTPIGLLLRAMGRDPMHRRFERDRASYWVKRNEAVNPDRYFRQF